MSANVESTLLDRPGHVIKHGDAIEFILSGCATVTLENAESGKHFSYRVRQAEASGSEFKPSVWFVEALLGPERIPTYIGFIKMTGFIHGGRKSRVSADAQCVKVFSYVWRHLEKGDLDECVEVWHEGKCGRCGRQLTDPESISLGIGPVCRGKMIGC